MQKKHSTEILSTQVINLENVRITIEETKTYETDKQQKVEKIIVRKHKGELLNIIAQILIADGVNKEKIAPFVQIISKAFSFIYQKKGIDTESDIKSLNRELQEKIKHISTPETDEE